LIEQAWEEKEA